MAIDQRDLDVTQTRELLSYSLGVGATVPIATGSTFVLGPIPFPCQIVAAEVAAFGLSGSPVLTLQVGRFIVGTGYTTIGLNATLTAAAWGTSGPQGFSTASFGSTSLQQGATTIVPLYTGDAILLTTSAANTAAINVGVNIVIRALQDIKTHYGI